MAWLCLAWAGNSTQSGSTSNKGEMQAPSPGLPHPWCAAAIQRGLTIEKGCVELGQQDVPHIPPPVDLGVQHHLMRGAALLQVSLCEKAEGHH